MTEDSMTAYFLGLLSESESRRVEEDSLWDEELSDQLRAAEEALIDAYTQNELTPEKKTLFERNYLNTQRRQETVALARALRQKYHSAASNSARANETTPVYPSGRRVQAGRRAAWISAIAAVLLLTVVVGLWTTWRKENASSRQVNGGRAPTPQATVFTSVASPPAMISPDATASPVSTPSISSTPSLAPSPRNVAPGSAQRTPVFATFTLSPGSLRSENATGQVLNLSPASTVVRLQLLLKENNFRSYRAELQTPEGATVLRQQGLNATAAEAHVTVVLEMPAHILESRHYVLILYGLPESKPGEPAAEYAFRVNKE